MQNMNTRDYLDKVKVEICESLRQIDSAPSVQMHATKASHIDKTAAIDAADPDVRLPDELTDGIIADDGEFYDDEREGGDLKNRQSYKRVKRAGSPIETELSKRNKDEI